MAITTADVSGVFIGEDDDEVGWSHRLFPVLFVRTERREGDHTSSRLEGVFYFPLPQDASISGFGMWIDGELVEADVVEKQRAREIYETILRERRDPGLLEWTGGNLFNRSELGGDPILVQQGGYLDGLNSIAGLETPTWNVSMNFSYPIGMRSGKAV